MHVEFSNSIREIDSADWDSVVHQAGAPVFYRHAYVSAYEQSPLTAVDAFAYFVAREGGKPVAVLPAYLQTAANPLRRLHEVYPEAAGEPAPLSHTWHCYDAHVIEVRHPTLEGGRGNAPFKRRHGLSARHLDAVLFRV